MSLHLLAKNSAQCDVTGVSEYVEQNGELRVNQQGFRRQGTLQLGKHSFVMWFSCKLVLMFLGQGKERRQG